MAKAPHKTEPAVQAKTEPAAEVTATVTTPKNEVFLDEEGQKLNDFIASIQADRQREEKAEEPRPQAPTERMRQQIALEMEAGRKRSEYFAEQQKNRVPPPPDKGEGTNTPVFRPPDHVPSMNSRDLGARALDV